MSAGTRQWADYGPSPLLRRALVTGCVMMATIMQALDMTIANVALPYMQGSLSATIDQVSWVLTSYVVAAAIMTAPVGWLASRFGARNLLMTCAAGFTVMMSIYSFERRGAAMTLWGMGVMIGPIMGPALGGWLTDHYSWRWVFYINLPFGIATVLGLWAFMRETEQRRATPFDWRGFASLSIAIGALQLMLDRGEQLGWFDAQEIVVEGLVSLAAFYFFLAHSLTAPRPFISIEIFRDRNFVIGLSFMFLCGLLLLGTAALMAPFLQNLAGYPVLDAGVLLGMRGVGTMLAMMLVGRLMARSDLRLLIAIGLAACVLSLYQSMDFSLDTSAGTIAWVGALQGAGLGFLFVPLNTMAFATLPAASRTEGTAMWTLIRNMGSSIGVSIVIANLSNKTILMHARLMEAVTPFNQALGDPAAGMLDPATETGRALLDNLITQQAGIIAYANDFKLLMLLTLFAFPLLLLIRSTR